MSDCLIPIPTVASSILNKPMTIGKTRHHDEATAPLNTNAMAFQP